MVRFAVILTIGLLFGSPALATCNVVGQGDFQAFDGKGNACTTSVGGGAAGGNIPPPTATSVQVSAGGTTAATPVAMPAVSAKTNFVCGFRIESQATSTATGAYTMAGILGGTMTGLMTTPAAPAPGIGQITQNFTPCLPASAVNTAITLTSAAPGTGGLVQLWIWGFVQ